MDLSNIMDFIPQNFVILIISIYVLGIFFKRIEAVKDKWITVILLLFGITFAVLLSIINAEYKIKSGQSNLGVDKEIEYAILQ